MDYTDSHLKWLVSGYEMFALNGPDNFKVEKLANQIGMNKSGFYHYFIDREYFFEEMMLYHSQIGENFANELSLLKDFLPGYPQLLCKYKTGFLIQIQLRTHFENPLFRKYYLIVKERNDKYQIPLWAKYLNLKDLQLAADLFAILTDLMVVRADAKKINFDLLVDIIERVKISVDKIKLNKY
jgi:AcrR family transcriptional regulator